MYHWRARAARHDVSRQDHLSYSAASLAEQTATHFQRRAAAVACLGYAILALALVSLAPRHMPAMPHITGIYATAVLVADVGTYVLLTAQFRASSRGGSWSSAQPISTAPGWPSSTC